MKQYNFDKIIDRTQVDTVKYGLRKPVFNNENVIPLWVADMDFETPDFIIEAMRQRVDHAVFGYGFRSSDYNKTISRWISKHYNWKVGAEEISFSPGVVPGLVMSILAFTKPGDKVLVQPPVYFPFYTSISGNNRELVFSPLKNTDRGYHMDFVDLEAKFKSGVKMFIMSNPHNPVGRVWTSEDLQQVVDLCAKYDVLILSDEIHADLTFGPNVHIPIASISKEAAMRTLTFMAASKTFNIAGLSTAFVVIQQKELLNRYNKTMDAMHLFTGNVMGAVATKAAFDNGDVWRKQMLEYVKGNIDFVADYIAEHIPKLHFMKPQATYLLWLDFSDYKLNQKDLVSLLVDKANVGLNDGTLFNPGGEGFMRMNVACPRSVLQQALEQIRDAL
ncbi:MAG: cystathionine beta-lyase [Bacteroidetes bacterium]|nr:MAG: cystathionine beta-lyase [Bacteroidota bacterium]